MSKPIDNPIIEFANAMRAVGLDVAHVIDDGRIHACKCSHDKGNKTSGRYFLHSDGFANGEFGCYHDTDNGLGNKWQSNTPDTRTDAEKAAAREQYAIQAAEREAQLLNEQAEAAKECKRLWSTAHDASSAHPYLKTKGVNAYGCKVLNGALLVPVYDGKNTIDNLVNIQFIQVDGTKRFKTGGKKQGCYFAFGSNDSKTAVICEGYSTGASIAQATGYRVVVAFDAGNLLPVAQRIKAALPDDWRVIVAADNDCWDETKPNTGMVKGQQAAHSIGALFVSPCFDGVDVSGKPSDFNDLHQLAGVEAVKLAFDGAQLLRNVEVETLTNLNNENLIKPIIQTIEAETDEAFIKRLAGFSSLEYARNSKGASERLGITMAQLNTIVKEERAKAPRKDANESGTSFLFKDVDPCDDSVNGAELLNDVLGQLQSYVIADHETLWAATLWVVMTWFVDYATVLPLAVITAPEKGCGKSTLLAAMGTMVHKPVTASSISPAAMFRLIEAYRPTLLLDEVDATFKDNEDLRGIVNSGHTLTSAHVIRTVGENHEPKVFSTWSAKLLCGIGRVPETIESRAIVLKMRRKVKGETVGSLRHAPDTVFETIKQRLARWSIDQSSAFSDMKPVMDGLNNRDADNYEPLLAIAMLAGGEWVKRVKAAARVLTASDGDNLSINEELLQDIRKVFEAAKVDKIKTTDLLFELCRDDDAPWKTYNRGRELTNRQLSKRLAEYGIKPALIRFGYSGVARGYTLDQFNDVFLRYLDNGGDLSVTTLQTSTGAGLGVTDNDFAPLEKHPSVTRKAPVYAGCNVVTDRNTKLSEKLQNEENVTGWLAEYDQAAQQIIPPPKTQGGETWQL